MAKFRSAEEYGQNPLKACAMVVLRDAAQPSGGQLVTPPPANPKVYHITHVDNLAGILSAGELLSDTAMTARGGPKRTIGMTEIKARRRQSTEVRCHPGTMVGNFVPLNFCPRSVMLYVIYMANHESLAYRDGQGPVVHLELDQEHLVLWAESAGQKWAFSDVNAGAAYAEFWAKLDKLDRLDWKAIEAADFRPSSVKDHKQAEFLVHERIPFTLVKRIGVHSLSIKRQVVSALESIDPQPPVEVLPAWYY